MCLLPFEFFFLDIYVWICIDIDTTLEEREGGGSGRVVLFEVNSSVGKLLE